MTATESRLVARLLALVERFGTPSGHLDHREGIDYRGVCVGHRTYRGGGERVKDGAGYRMVGQTFVGVCAPSCQEWQAVRAEAQAYLAATHTRQLALMDAAG